MMNHLRFIILAAWSEFCGGFVIAGLATWPLRHNRILLAASSKASDETVDAKGASTALQDLEDTVALDSDIAGQFKILTCSSTSCAKRRQALGLDEYATFSAFYTRAAERAPAVQVEECPCLGQCSAAPCVAIEHADYEGTVALEGMTNTEFQNRVFQNVCFEEDADRVWTSVENAIRILAAEEEGDVEETTSPSEYSPGQGVEV